MSSVSQLVGRDLKVGRRAVLIGSQRRGQPHTGPHPPFDRDLKKYISRENVVVLQDTQFNAMVFVFDSVFLFL